MREGAGWASRVPGLHSLITYCTWPYVSVISILSYSLSLGGQQLNRTPLGFPVTLPGVQNRLFISVLNAKATCGLLFILQDPA